MHGSAWLDKLSQTLFHSPFPASFRSPSFPNFSNHPEREEVIAPMISKSLPMFEGLRPSCDRIAPMGHCTESVFM